VISLYNNPLRATASKGVDISSDGFEKKELQNEVFGSSFLLIKTN